MQRRQPRPRLVQAILDAVSLPDLRYKILFTLGILIIFRFIAHVPVPGVNPEVLSEFFKDVPLLGMLDLFSGGAMRNFSIAAMGVYPYITSSIIMQLMVPVVPRLRALSLEGESGRRKINLYTHWLTVPMAALQGYGQIVLMRNAGVLELEGSLPTMAIILSMVAGTMFLVWLGELITERGIGNGISIIIFGGILVGMPSSLREGYITGGMASLTALVLFMVAIMVFIVVVTEGHRRIPVQYARSTFRGGRMYRQSGATHIPLRVNIAGMIPLIFAMSLIMLPGIIAQYFSGGVADFLQTWFSIERWSYWLIYFLLVMGFTFFYTMIIFEQMNLADTLQKQGGFVPGIRPGRNTAAYLAGVIHHLTWAAALFLGTIAIMPYFSQWITDVPRAGFMILSSAGLLIVVGVALDTMKQLEAQLLMRRYEGFLK